MNVFQKLKEIPVAKLTGLAFLGIIILVIAIWLLGFAIRSALVGNSGSYEETVQNRGYGVQTGAFAPSIVSQDVNYEVRPTPVPPSPGYSAGDAEAYEITEYSASLKTRKLTETCSAFESLKPRKEIIFEYANRYDHGCSYSFKVLKANADEIVVFIKNLKPETFAENTQTIKSTIEYYINEEEILQKKLESIEMTLLEAGRAYDSVQELATQTKDIENLAKIIDSKVKLIERLTQERLNTKERLDRISKSKAEQLDRLSYTFFRVDITEIILIDVKELKNSWVNETAQFVRELNSVLQGVTIELAEFGLRVFQAALYILLALLVAKYGWVAIKILWRGKRERVE